MKKLFIGLTLISSISGFAGIPSTSAEYTEQVTTNAYEKLPALEGIKLSIDKSGGGVREIVWLNNTEFLIGGTQNGFLALYDLKNPTKPVRNFKGQVGITYGIKKINDNVFMSYDGSGSVYFWNKNTGKKLAQHKSKTGLVFGTVDVDANSIITYGGYNKFFIRDLKNPNTILKEFSGHSAFSSIYNVIKIDSNTILSTNAQNELFLWDINGKLITRFSDIKIQEGIFNLTKVNDNEIFATRKNEVTFWDLAHPYLPSWSIKASGMHDAKLISASNLLVVNKGAVNLWDIKNRKLIKKFTNGHNPNSYRVGLGILNKKQFVTFTHEGELILWNVLLTNPEKKMEGHKKFVEGIVNVPNSNNFISYDGEGTFILWKLR